MADTSIVLGTVEKHLESNPRNPRIVVVNKTAKDYSPDDSFGPLGQMVEYSVAPKDGLYTERELQSFMRGLVGDLRLSSITNFRQHNGRLDFGSLHLSETIDGYRRRTVIRVYPDETIARHREYKFGIDIRDMKEYHRAQTQGILHRVGELVMHHSR